MNVIRNLFVCSVILGLGAGITYMIFSTEPKAERERATKRTPMLVSVIGVKKGNYKPIIEAVGVVKPSKEIYVEPLVSGKVSEISPSFVPGGLFKKGDLFFKIEPIDYKNNLLLQESELKTALAEYQLEQGYQNAALEDYNLVKEKVSNKNKNLILRKPQLEIINAKISAAKAKHNQAKVELGRTIIKAPFDGQLLERKINIGSNVSVNEQLGNFVGTDEYWVVVSLPLSKLPWLQFPKNRDTKLSEVTLINKSTWQPNQKRKGHLINYIGSLNEKSRLVRIIISVKDPLAIKNNNLPKLILESFINVNLQAKELRNVYKLERKFIHSKNKVWLMVEKKLKIQQVEIEFLDGQYAYITKGLKENDKVIITNLSRVVDGAELRLTNNE